MKKSENTGISFINGVHFEHLIETTYFEKCSSCGFIYDDSTELEEAGAPISGIYFICPKCKKNWDDSYKEIVVKTERQICISEKEFNKITKNKFIFKAPSKTHKGDE